MKVTRAGGRTKKRTQKVEPFQWIYPLCSCLDSRYLKGCKIRAGAKSISISTSSDSLALSLSLSLSLLKSAVTFVTFVSVRTRGNKMRHRHTHRAERGPLLCLPIHLQWELVSPGAFCVSPHMHIRWHETHERKREGERWGQRHPFIYQLARSSISPTDRWWAVRTATVRAWCHLNNHWPCFSYPRTTSCKLTLSLSLSLDSYWSELITYSCRSQFSFLSCVNAIAIYTLPVSLWPFLTFLSPFSHGKYQVDIWNASAFLFPRFI